MVSSLQSGVGQLNMQGVYLSGGEAGAENTSTLVQGCLSPRLMGELLLPKAGPGPLATLNFYPCLLFLLCGALNALLVSHSANIGNT